MKINDFVNASNNYESMSRQDSKKSNKKGGRKAKELPSDFKTVYDGWKTGELSVSDACVLLDIEGKYSTFYYMVKKYEKMNK